MQCGNTFCFHGAFRKKAEAVEKEQKTRGAFIRNLRYGPGDYRYTVLTAAEGSDVKTLTAKNPSEARGIRKALKAAGVKFEFKTTRRRAVKKKRNPVKRRGTKKKSTHRNARRKRR